MRNSITESKKDIYQVKGVGRKRIYSVQLHLYEDQE